MFDRGVPLRSIRVRILVGYVVLLGLALVITLIVVRSALVSRFDIDVDRRLADEIDQLQLVIADGDPETGAAFVSAADLFGTHLRRVLPGDAAAFYTLIEGVPFEFSFGAPAELLERPDLVADWAAVEQSRFTSIDTEAGRARVLVVPIELESDTGTFVTAAYTDSSRRELDEVVRLLTIVGGGVLLISALFAWTIAARVVKPIRELTDVARSITDTDLTTRIPVTNESDDEVTELSRTFNAMMERLEAGFSSQRAFLDDVAHELRTPITIIQGHIDVLGHDPAERDETVALVTDELERMTRYVDDLLVLAQAERPDFLRPQSVELSDFLDGLVAKLPGFGNRVWTIDQMATGTARFDRQRMYQALLNLAANAVRHTAPGDEIGFGVSSAGTQLRFTVRDTGDGVDPQLIDDIFERHIRSAASRTQGGVGLGLSIVDAIAVAHGGTVSVASPPGSGATFTISITNDATSEEP